VEISKYAKAGVAAVAAGAASLVTALDDSTVTTQEGLTAVVAVLGALGLTWAVPNRKQVEPGVRE
jgi:peptidoglycan/LPS O-acetylase OafA/YrhL